MILRPPKLVVLALAYAPSLAFAADLPARTAPAMPLPSLSASDWSGPYAGAFLGGGLGMFSTRNGAVSASASGLGYSSGALAGYNWQSGAFVYGLEADIGSQSIRAKFAARPGFAANQIESVASLHGRARLGYDLGAFMPYLAAGLAYDRIDQSLQQPFDFDGAARSRAGWTIGAGVDAKVTLPILGPSVLRAEYLYEAMPRTSFDLNGPMFSTRAATHIARLALISRIGENWKPAADPGIVDWSGVYFGAIGGGQSHRISTSGAVASTSFSANGAAGGVYAGHNWMFGDTMLGIDGATMLANVSGSGAQPGAISTSYRDYFSADFRGRVGYSLGRFMPFAAAGLGFDNTEQFDPLTGRTQGNIASVSGVAGVGVEIMATERIVLRAEYLYAHTLGSRTTHLDGETCCNQTRASNSLRFGVAWLFH